jgi:hypothetical protein
MITNCNDDVLVVKFPGTVVAVSSTSTETYTVSPRYSNHPYTDILD